MTQPLQAQALILVAFMTIVTLAVPSGVAAQGRERLCDTQFEDCRAPILDLIRNEQRGIDVAFWFMEDGRYTAELIKRHQAGVPVRVLVDQRANSSHPRNAQYVNELRCGAVIPPCPPNGGVPMREKWAGDIMHFKMMLFHGQNMVEFSKANYTPFSFVANIPNVDYQDEAIFFTDDDNLTDSFRQRFDDLWVDTGNYRNLANITNPLVRSYPISPNLPHPSMNFMPLEDFSIRSASRYNDEQERIDAIVFRVTDPRHSDAMIAAVGRGVPVRIITEPSEYRNPARVWHAKEIDRMWMGRVQIKNRKHEGVTHEAAVVLHGLGEVIFGSSNWTEASGQAGRQDEHNYFYNPSLGKPWFFQWFADQFDRKWNDTTNYVTFQPQPPGTPAYSSPSNAATGLSSSVTLTWDGGPWAHFYDIYFGTTSTPPLLAANVKLGSPDSGVRETYTVNNLSPGTTYYWRIVGKTWAQLSRSGATWSFTTSGGSVPPPPPPPPPSGGSTPFGGTPAAIPGTFQAENFDNGGQNVAYFDAAAGNSGGVYRPTDVDLQATTDSGGGYNVGWTRAGEWLKYTVNVATTGTYKLETRVANMGAGGTFRVEVDGADRTGPITVPDTGGWQTWQTITTNNISLTAGTRVLRVMFATAASSGGVGNYNWFRLTSSSSSSTSPFGGTPVSLPGVVQAENFDLGAQGAAYQDASAGNSGGVYRSTDVDIGPTSDASSGGYYLGWTRTGEWLKYTVNVTATRNYTLRVRVANVGSGARFRLEADGADLTGSVAVPDTGGWDVWQTVTLSVPLTQGQRVLRLVMVNANGTNAGVGNYGYLAFE